MLVLQSASLGNLKFQHQKINISLQFTFLGLSLTATPGGVLKLLPDKDHFEEFFLIKTHGLKAKTQSLFGLAFLTMRVTS